mmetsp:Transcript_28966/g.75078  ORF Transcript_28966/g.75078 Transcript_28966/m.75078 type:complete len:253 (+) Transcript_28966:1971-2729(+)
MGCSSALTRTLRCGSSMLATRARTVGGSEKCFLTPAQPEAPREEAPTRTRTGEPAPTPRALFRAVRPPEAEEIRDMQVMRPIDVPRPRESSPASPAEKPPKPPPKPSVARPGARVATGGAAAGAETAGSALALPSITRERKSPPRSTTRATEGAGLGSGPGAARSWCRSSRRLEDVSSMSHACGVSAAAPCDGASVGTRCGRCSLSVTKPRRMARTQRRQKRIEWVAMVVGTYEMSDVRRPRRLEMAATSSA